MWKYERERQNKKANVDRIGLNKTCHTASIESELI